MHKRVRSSNPSFHSSSLKRCKISVNEVKLLALRTGLREAYRLRLCQLSVESDSCAIQWASDNIKASWSLADVVEEVIDLAPHLDVSFHHVKRSTNSFAESLENKGVSCPNLMISYSDSPIFLILFNDLWLIVFRDCCLVGLVAFQFMSLMLFGSHQQNHS